MSLFGDFIGGAAASLSQSLASQVAEQMRTTAEEKKARLADKLARGQIRLENSLLLKREKEQQAALTERAGIDANRMLESERLRATNREAVERARQEAANSRAAANRASAAESARYSADQRVKAAEISAAARNRNTKGRGLADFAGSLFGGRKGIFD